MKRLASICGLAFLILVPVLSAQTTTTLRRSDPPRFQTPPTAEERRRIRGLEGSSWQEAVTEAAATAMLPPGARVDVERYFIDLRVTPETERVDGSVGLQVRSLEDGLTGLEVDLYDELSVFSIVAGATPLTFTRGANRLQIDLDRAYGDGELIDITISYGGTPPSPGFGSFTFRTHNGNPIISSLSEPSYAPTWWPCIDHPADKAIVEMDLTVPSTLIGVSNGLLIGQIDNPDSTTTYQWRSDYPISTYLVSVAISNYQTWTDWYMPVTGGPAMPVQHWVYPEHFAAAQQDLGVTVPMLEFFSGLFGEYPFVEEKYGHAIFPFGGAMEHQTATSYGAVLIRGDNYYDWIVAHELAHQWWGDSISPAEWAEIWLNEGFATYSEVLWQEHLGGAAARHAWMASLDTRPFCGTLYDPGPCGLFGHTVYDKGGWVVHMLRHVVGDTAFFQGLRDYAATYALANASTPDLQAIMEAASGRSLGPFFDRWVYQSGEPIYQWGWSAAQVGTEWVTYVRIEQTSPGPPFPMPIDIRVNTPGNSTTFIVENTAAAEDFALPPLPKAPIDVEFDPDDWILKTESQMTLPDGDGDGVPNTADNCLVVENPAQEDLDGDGLGDACDPDRDGDGRDDVADCAPLNPGVQDPPPELAGLTASGVPLTHLEWNPSPGDPPGETYDLLRGSLSDLRPDLGVTGAQCFATGLTQPEAEDPDTPLPGQGVYFLVRAVNVCGAGDLGTTSADEPRSTPLCP
jgi:hypothetical protein